MTHSKKALIVIDLQNDYFPDGNFPLWNSDAVLGQVEDTITRAHRLGVPVVLVQHVVEGESSFFQQGTTGVEIHPRIKAAAPNAPVVVKAFADSFHHTTLEATLQQLGVDELLVCGMMTQNCVTHTAISKAAEKYKVSILGDCCTTVTEVLHQIALNGVSTRVPVVLAAEALA